MVDPLGGSTIREALTDDLERRIGAELDVITQHGGALGCIESGYFARALGDSAWQLAQSVDSGERTVVGVNKFVTDPVAFEVFSIDPAAERDQVASLERVRATRDASAVRDGLESVRLAAQAGENVVPACVQAVTAYATVGEIADVLRQVHGVWTPSTSF